MLGRLSIIRNQFPESQDEIRISAISVLGF